MWLLASILLISTAASLPQKPKWNLTLNALPVEKNCTCMPFYQCSIETRELITGGSFRDRQRQSACEGYMEVCCSTYSQHLPTPSDGDYEEPQSDAKSKYCDYQSSTTASFSGVLIDLFDGDKYICGFSLVDPIIGMTAAHCVKKGRRYLVQIGYETRLVEDIIIHEHYNSRLVYNDVALLILDNEILPSEIIGIVCISSVQNNVESMNAICTVNARQGKFLKFNESTSQKDAIFKVANVTMIPRKACQHSLRNTRLGKMYMLHRSFMCTSGTGNGTCGGRGGNPLMCSLPGKPAGYYYQAGIVSWGIKCGTTAPDVYVDLSQFREWILSWITKRGSKGIGTDDEWDRKLKQ